MIATVCVCYPCSPRPCVQLSALGTFPIYSQKAGETNAFLKPQFDAVKFALRPERSGFVSFSDLALYSPPLPIENFFSQNSKSFPIGYESLSLRRYEYCTVFQIRMHRLSCASKLMHNKNRKHCSVNSVHLLCKKIYGAKLPHRQIHRCLDKLTKFLRILLRIFQPPLPMGSFSSMPNSQVMLSEQASFSAEIK